MVFGLLKKSEERLKKQKTKRGSEWWFDPFSLLVLCFVSVLSYGLF